MGRPSEFVDPEYDRKLAEYKALKAKLRAQGQLGQSSQSSNSSQRQ